MPLHRHNFGWLMLKRVDPMKVTRKNLKRCNNNQHPHGHRKHPPRGYIYAIAQQMQTANAAHNKRSRQISGQDHMDQAVREGRVEDDRPPIFRYKLAQFVDAIASWCLHPRVD